MSLDLKVEHCRPNEGEHAPGEAANEAHEDGEMRDNDSEHDGDDDDRDPEPETPNLKVTVQRPNRGKDSVRLTL